MCIINLHKNCNKKARKASQKEPLSKSDEPKKTLSKSDEPKKVSGPIDDPSEDQKPLNLLIQAQETQVINKNLQQNV